MFPELFLVEPEHHLPLGKTSDIYRQHRCWVPGLILSQIVNSTAMSPFLCQLMCYLRSLAGACLTSCVVRLLDYYRACAFVASVVHIFCSKLIDLTCFSLPASHSMANKEGKKQPENEQAWDL